MILAKFVRVENRIEKDHVVLEATTSCDLFTDLPMWVEVVLSDRKTGEWYSSYQGFVDWAQLAEWRKDYNVAFAIVGSDETNSVNAQLRASGSFEGAMEVLRRVGAISVDGQVRRFAIVPMDSFVTVPMDEEFAHHARN
jgi:hypothetical protein